MSQNATKAWFTRVMTKIINSLGSDVSGVEYELKEEINLDSTCPVVSDVFHARMKFYSKTHDRNENLALILKRPTQIKELIRIHRSELQFYNETVFYQMYAEPSDNFAKCFYFDLRPPSDSVIALEDVTERGYRACPYMYDAPLDYTLAAVREIARFHGKGYVMKELQRERFFDIVTRFQETRFYDTVWGDNFFKPVINMASTRSVEYLRSRGYDTVFCDKAEALLSNAYREVTLKAIPKLKPLATLCHGDFTATNVLFKTGDDGQHQAMLIDFALMRYATPAIDLSTYLSLCCANEIRREKFSEILKTYHDALKEYLLEAGVYDVEKYSYDALLDDYRRHGLFGYALASFFVPILRGKYAVEDTLHEDKREEWTKRSGGDEISEILAGMLLHLKDLGCLNL